MLGSLAALAAAPIKRRLRRAVFLAILAGVAAALAFIALAGVAGASFFALEPEIGPIRASLAVSGGALVLAVLASAPIWWPRRRPPPSDATLAQFVSALARAAPALSSRQTAFGAALLALAVGLMAGDKNKTKP